MYDGGCMRENIEERVLKIAAYVLQTGGTVRDAAKEFDVSKSTVHSDLVKRLPKTDAALYKKVKIVLEKNLRERHIRGGEKTRQKYSKMRK